MSCDVRPGHTSPATNARLSQTTLLGSWKHIRHYLSWATNTCLSSASVYSIIPKFMISIVRWTPHTGALELKLMYWGSAGTKAGAERRHFSGFVFQNMFHIRRKNRCWDTAPCVFIKNNIFDKYFAHYLTLIFIYIHHQETSFVSTKIRVQAQYRIQIIVFRMITKKFLIFANINTIHVLGCNVKIKIF